MSVERTFEPGEVVYLLAEIRAGGRIHEIGTRGTVLDVLGSGVLVELSGSPAPVTCPATYVEPAVERRRRARRPVGARMRLRDAA